MNEVATLGWVGAASILGIAFLAGLAPVLTIRIAALLYPKGHSRRDDLYSDMIKVREDCGIVEQYRWLGENVGEAIWNGPSARRRDRQARVGLRRAEARARLRRLARETRAALYEQPVMPGFFSRMRLLCMTGILVMGIVVHFYFGHRRPGRGDN